MKLNLFKTALFTVACAVFSQAQATGWPSNYEGVMLQGFYWDSYSGTDNTKWTTLTSQADELSESFSLIWVPNSAKAASSPSMGYDPVYWFTNHNSSFGTADQLKTMISTFKSHGVGIIEDVVVNHRSGVSNWTNFPSETWNGTTYKLGPEHICSTDEVKNATGQAKPTGAPDTGEDFGGARDLDHTNATVQNNVKNYCKFLLEELGYAGFRLDMVKGYAGKYTKIYNEYAKPRFCVGEYWDGSYDAVAGWIEATGKESAAFDFPLKYCINEAFSSKNYTKLVWKANGTTDQPAGLIHFGYPQYSVTFIDNHDTYRDGSKFNGNIVAANAFILCSPGTPCVFWKHWSENKSAIKRLIAIRKAVGLHNQSAVKVLRSTSDCYMAEVTGTKGKLVVKIGSAMVSPDGYTNDDIKATGTDYCVWTKTGINVPDPTPDSYPSQMYLIGNINGESWNTSTTLSTPSVNGVYTWNNVELDPAASGETVGYFSFITKNGANWDAVNTGDRYGSSSKDEPIFSDTPSSVILYEGGGNSSSAPSWKATAGKYKFVLDLTKMKVTISATTEIEEITSEDVQVKWFTLQGTPVESPSKGIYIKVSGNKSEKIVL